jgi:hypothetical protein
LLREKGEEHMRERDGREREHRREKGKAREMVGLDAASAVRLSLFLLSRGHFGPIQTYKCCKWVQEGFIRRKGQSSGRARI